jgi:hypothetical protein
MTAAWRNFRARTPGPQMLYQDELRRIWRQARNHEPLDWVEPLR